MNSGPRADASIRTVNLKTALCTFSEQWSPRIVGELNGQVVKIAKVQGEFIWHRHDREDELFLVLKGSLTIRLRDRSDILLREGELAIIPRGVEHCPVADEECHILLFEPATTLNTGNLRNERTIEVLERL